MAVAAEAAELLEHFQWLTDEQSRTLPSEKRKEIALELADILIYLVRLSDKLDLDLFAAVSEKIQINELRYPSKMVRGSPKKYTEY